MLLNYYYAFLISVTALVIVQPTHEIEGSNKVTRYDHRHNVLHRYRRQSTINNQRCRIPNNPLNTKYTTTGASEQILESGDYADNWKTLNISCDRGYRLSRESEQTYCINGTWSPSPKNCLRICPSLTSTSTTNVQCMLNNGILEDCNNPIEGTIARLSCNPWFEHPALEKSPTRLCRGGRWHLPIHQCYSTCGLKTSKGVINIINGTDVVGPGSYPWQIGVYKTADKEIICGGSIIEPHVILSAAHCFADFDGNVQPTDNYVIAGGKYYRRYDDERDQLAQYSQILKIYVPERFKARYNLYSSDIAIIILKDPFQFTEVVQPVCINLKEQRQQLLDSTGIVTGWGYTEEGRNLSDVLQELTVPLVPFNLCFNQVPEAFRRYITDDKICAGYKDKGTSVCQGDSGGALVYKNFIDGRHYVIGIVSTSPASDALSCDSNEYGTYTSVSHHYQFIQDILAQNQPYETIECTDTECSNGHVKNKTDCSSSNNFCDTTTKNCEIPPNPRYTEYKMLGEFETNYKSGDFVNEFSILEIRCHEGYKLSPFASNMSICINGKWSQSPTTCLDTCPSLISTETTAVKCSYNNIPLENCNSPVNETTALLSCNPLYEEPNIEKNPVRVCRQNRWDPPIAPCYPVCGNKHPKGMALIVNGRDAVVGDYPWHIGIYYSSNTKKFKCSGFIIDQNIILTAAHCVTDHEGKVKPTNNYVVAGGKYFRKYNESKDQFAQYSNISAIHVQERYKGDIGKNALNIAVLILSEPFTLSEAVQPVCIQLNRESGYVDLTANNNGIVTGWGFTVPGGNLSDVLKEMTVPHIPFNKCFDELPRKFKIYFAEDSICGGYLNNGTSVCAGDSGGALVFKNVLNDRYFVKGIVSTSLSTDLGCDTNQYSLYTSIDYHINFVRDLVALNQVRTPIECIGRDCTNKENQLGKNKKTKNKNCEIPINPLYGKYQILEETATNHKPGDLVNEFSALELRCHKGFSLSPIAPKISLCINGTWDSPPTTCFRTCPSLISTKSTAVKCSYNNVPLENCINPIKGTTALLSCNPLYEEPDIQRNSVRVCKESRWDPPAKPCYPACGQKHPKGMALIINGQDAVVGDYPWHVGIYSSETKELWCGGSIISENIILTAAHCLTDQYGNDVTIGEFLIAAGKYFRKYDEAKDQLAQYSNVSAFYVQERYRGSHNLLGLDIAVVILSHPFTLSEAVQPVCIALSEESRYLQLSLNNGGEIPGWGYVQEDGPLSDVLQELMIPYVPFSKCFNALPDHFKQYLTQDKFCGGYLNQGKSVCSGDSGEGLVLKNALNDRYFIKGIASLAPHTESGTCDSNQYSLYTSIDHHIEFVRNLVALNQLRMPLECTNNDCRTETNQTEQKNKEINSEKCMIPFNILSVKYKILGESEISYRPGDTVKQFSGLEISCYEDYKLSPFAPNMSICINGKWIPSPATCHRTCPSLISVETTRVKCKYNNIPLDNCINPVNGTIALLTCNPLYEELNIQRNPVRLCRDNRWEPSATFCYPICGVKYPKGNADVEVSDHPWQIGIYSRDSKRFVCSGTLIDQNIILTAADCVTDYDGNVQPVGNYAVAAGKHFIEYYDARDLLVQYSKVLAIYVPEQYKGRYNMFAFDIAILILSDPFTLSEGVQPACIELSEPWNLSSTNGDGVIASWGSNQGEELSEGLKELTVPYIPFIKCYNDSAENITGDKFCGGNETTLRDVDSGGGLTFRNALSGRYFVKGVVSRSPTEEVTSDQSKYSLYTSVDHHINFLRDLIALNQLQRPLECLNSDCTN